MGKNIILLKYLNNVQCSAVKKNKVTLNKTESIGNNCLTDVSRGRHGVLGRSRCSFEPIEYT